MQQFHLGHFGCAPLQLNRTGWTYRFEGTIFWLERPKKHACKHRYAVYALRVLETFVSRFLEAVHRTSYRVHGCRLYGYEA